MTHIRSISANLELDERDIWHSKNAEEVSYPSEGNNTCFPFEDASFWFRHRNQCIASAVTLFPPEQGETIFDIGGGNGFVALALKEAGFNVALVEPGLAGCHHAKERGIETIICATTDTAGFKPHSIPAAGLFDVIEHIEDDIGFLQSVKEMIQPDGYLYATVPAYSFLWSQKDISVGHFRRYTLKRICSVLETAGFQIEFASYIFRLFPFVIYLKRTLPYKLGIPVKGTKAGTDPQNHHVIKNGMIKNMINALIQPEVKKLQKKQTMLFGSSCLVVAKAI